MNLRSIRLKLHAPVVEINFDDPGVKTIIRDYLFSYLSEDPSSPSIVFNLRRRFDVAPKVPEGADWFFNYQGIAGFRSGDKYYYVTSESAFVFDSKAGKIDAVVGDDLLAVPHYFTHGIFNIVLMEALRYHGLYYLHAAGLTSPGGKGVVVTGDSASGKTTFAVSLIKLGWRWLTDDTILLRNEDGEVRLLPFLTEFHIPPGLSERVEELNFLADTNPYCLHNEKRAVWGEEIYGDSRITSMNPPDVIFFSKIVDNPVSEIRKIETLEAVNEIIRNSPYVLFSKPPAKAHLEALKAIVQGARCYRLFAGADIYNNPVEGVGRVLAMAGLD